MKTENPLVLHGHLLQFTMKENIACCGQIGTKASGWDVKKWYNLTGFADHLSEKHMESCCQMQRNLAGYPPVSFIFA